MEVKYLATITIPDEGWDVNQEEACWEAGQKASRDLFLRALRQVEEKVLAQDSGEKKGRCSNALKRPIKGRWEML